jgi:CheY-like chemotaxis protein
MSGERRSGEHRDREAREAVQTSSPLRVLVVDDNADAASMLSMLVELQGHTTASAHSGPEALHVADRFHPDVVLLDIGLPGLDGYHIARELRRRPGGGGLVLAALTGWSSDEDKRRTREAGFDLHLTKPVDLAEIQGR